MAVVQHRRDFSCADDLAANEPAKLKEMQAAFLAEALKYNVLPLDERLNERLNPTIAGRPDQMGGRTSLALFPGMIAMKENAFIDVKNRSSSITAHLEIPGTVSRESSSHRAARTPAGAFTSRTASQVRLQLPGHVTTIAGKERLPAGPVTLSYDFAYDGGKPEQAAPRHFRSTGQGRVRTNRQTIPFLYRLETADVGVDLYTPVTPDYTQDDNKFTGTINKVCIDVRD